MMELRLIARILLRYWWLVLIPTVIAAAFAAPALLSGRASTGGFATSIRYSAAQQPDAQPPRDGDYQDIWLASELTVNALTAWVQTESFRREIARQLDGQSIDLAALGVHADNERSVGVIDLTHPDSASLQTIARAAIEVLQSRNSAYFPQVGSAPAAVTLLDEPVIVVAPPPLTNRFEPLIRVGLGLIAGLGLAFLAHYLDPTLRQREEVESLGLPVVGTLPRD
jgi:capsular polysaccharide biosynthesis protein